jgi:hypothetical protein
LDNNHPLVLADLGNTPRQDAILTGGIEFERDEKKVYATLPKAVRFLVQRVLTLPLPSVKIRFAGRTSLPLPPVARFALRSAGRLWTGRPADTL